MIRKILKKTFYTITPSIYNHIRPNRYEKSRKIYITFDDGPHNINTAKVLSVLKNKNIKGTFFIVGKEIEQNYELLKRIIREGHSIGYHSFSHTNITKQSLFEFHKDIQKGKTILKELNSNQLLYRPPYGKLSLIKLLYLYLNQWKTIMWSIDSRDSFISPENVIENLSNTLFKGGDIILFHDDYENTADILNIIIDKIHSQRLTCSNLESL